MRIKLLAVFLTAAVISCSGNAGAVKINPAGLKYPDSRFMVISDIHYFDRSLFADPASLNKLMSGDRKMLVQSSELFRSMIDIIKQNKPEFLVISGDLTKDGEEASHRKVAEGLGEISRMGIRVFVVPGNHDIDNPAAERYEKMKAVPVPSVSDKKFIEIYKDAGYSSAIERDSGSLSYMAEPVKGLRLLALDSCKWKENPGRKKPVTSGKFDAATLKWAEKVLARSKKDNIPVIAVLHHGILEHFPGNKASYGAWILDNAEEVTRLLCSYGVQAVFTGHFHAQDITVKKFSGGASIYDIETGSLVTYPCPYRLIEISRGRMKISSGSIDSIPSMPDTFREFKYQYIYNGTITISRKTLQRYFVSEQDIGLIGPKIAGAYMLHTAGDEPVKKMKISSDGLSVWGGIVMATQRKKVDGWLTDLPPADNSLVIDLSSGNVINP